MQPDNSVKAASPKKKTATAGSFAKGKSGNPGGRPRKTEAEFELEKACEEKTPEALGVIEALMRDETAKESVRLAAAQFIIERRYGKSVERKEIRTGPLDGLGHEQLRSLQEALNEFATAQPIAGSTSSTTH